MTDYPYPRVGLLIDGEWIYDRPGGEDIVNPSDESIIGRTTHATEADLDRALAAAERGFAVWRKVSPPDRSVLLHRVADLVRDPRPLLPVSQRRAGLDLARAR